MKRIFSAVLTKESQSPQAQKDPLARKKLPPRREGCNLVYQGWTYRIVILWMMRIFIKKRDTGFSNRHESAQGMRKTHNKVFYRKEEEAVVSIKDGH
mmetsp:Transcript_21322/g.31359  ORF Transcript_21322/g.31359 Transcript_21322/m.31359 type:complete len:97 (-) Transcript_21322:259-549(-)